MKLADQPRWRRSLLRGADDAPFRDWLLDRGSLTARIQGRGRFAVRVLRQGRASPTADEALALGLADSRHAWVREVVLSCDEQIVVFAHTVLPCQPRGPLTLWLKRLGSRSLGALLFAHAGFIRGAMNFNRIDRRHELFAPAVTALQLAEQAPRWLWARRSHFGFGAQCVLVTEVFSPRLLEALLPSQLARPGSGIHRSVRHPTPGDISQILTHQTRLRKAPILQKP